MNEEIDMDEVLEIANTAYQQIKASVGIMVLGSWGLHKKVATMYKGKPSLKLSVNGRLFKGDVYVSYDKGGDCYLLYFEDGKGTKVLDYDVYCGELGKVLDENIEMGKNMEEYRKAFKWID
jgi:hypothetical protein